MTFCNIFPFPTKVCCPFDLHIFGDHETCLWGISQAFVSDAFAVQIVSEWAGRQRWGIQIVQTAKEVHRWWRKGGGVVKVLAFQRKEPIRQSKVKVNASHPAVAPASQVTNSLFSWDKYISQFETNTFCNLIQIHFAIWDKYIVQFETNTFCYLTTAPLSILRFLPWLTVWLIDKETSMRSSGDSIALWNSIWPDT